MSPEPLEFDRLDRILFLSMGIIILVLVFLTLLGVYLCFKSLTPEAISVRLPDGRMVACIRPTPSAERLTCDWRNAK